MENNPVVLIKKYSVPTLFLIMGIGMLYVGVSQNQDALFMLSAALMLFASILSILYSSGNLKPRILYILGGVAAVFAIITLFFSYSGVKKTQKYNADYAQCKNEAIENLQDIRHAQKLYLERNGHYAKDWSTLINFINTGTVPFVESQGVVPSRKMTVEESRFVYRDNRPIDNNMTELEAYVLAKSPIAAEDLKGFKRDTLQVSLLKTKYLSKTNIEKRKKMNFEPFKAENLQYIPFTKQKQSWKMEVKDSVQIGEDFLPTIEVSGYIPFAKIQGKANEKMSFGKITTNETTGSWEEK